jgi:hypothetical protein
MSRDSNLIGRILLATSVALACSGAAFANDIHVCGTCAHKTIQSAVNDAASGDNILIAQGTYVENVTVTGKALNIVGGPGATSVVAAGLGPVFTLGATTVGSTPQLVQISNLTISGGNHTGGTGDGGGIQVRVGAYLYLTNSIVTGNSALSGGGISMSTLPQFPNQITKSYIQNNTAAASAAAGGGSGGGIALLQGDVQIVQSFITQNVANTGGGLYEASTAHRLYFSEVSITQNTATPFVTSAGSTQGIAGGLYVGAYVEMFFTHVTDNTALGLQGTGGMYLVARIPPADIDANPATSNIDNSVFSQNFVLKGATNAAGVTLVEDPTNPTAAVSMTDVFVILNSGFGMTNNAAIFTDGGFVVEENSLGNCVGSGSGCP